MTSGRGSGPSVPSVSGIGDGKLIRCGRVALSTKYIRAHRIAEDAEYAAKIEGPPVDCCQIEADSLWICCERHARVECSFDVEGLEIASMLRTLRKFACLRSNVPSPMEVALMSRK